MLSLKRTPVVSLLIAVAILIAPPALTPAGAAPPTLEIRVLSNRADLISGGEALVEVVVPAGVLAANVRMDVGGRDVIILDDEISRGTTVFELLDRLHEEGAHSVAVACTHGLFADGALEKLAATDVTEIVCTNSAPLEAEHSKLTVLSVGPALAEAISRIHNGESVSSLFDH